MNLSVGINPNFKLPYSDVLQYYSKNPKTSSPRISHIFSSYISTKKVRKSSDA